MRPARSVRRPLALSAHTDSVQQTVLVALVTGILTATAALTASWLTSRATIKAAQVNVKSAAEIQRQDRIRDLRRSAYVDLLIYVTQIRWRARDLVARAAAGDTTAVEEFRRERNATGSELERRRYVVHLEGPESIRASVDRLQGAIDQLADDLDVALGMADKDEIEAAARTARGAVRKESLEFLVQAQAVLADSTPGAD